MTDDLDILFPKTETVKTDQAIVTVKALLFKNTKTALKLAGKYRDRLIVAENPGVAILSILDDPDTAVQDISDFVGCFEPEVKDLRRGKDNPPLTFPDDFTIDEVAEFLFKAIEVSSRFFRQRFQAQKAETPQVGEKSPLPSYEAALATLNLNEEQLNKLSYSTESASEILGEDVPTE
ncbi:MAG: hypothetical protein ACRC62_28360 [Microcoleus sp.]